MDGVDQFARGLPTAAAHFVPLVTEKVVLASKNLFQPANGVRSTHLLVKIHNRNHWNHLLMSTLDLS